MKKFNYLIIGCAVVYLVLAALLFIGSDAIRGENTDKFAYKVEIHQVMRELEDLDSPKEQEIIDLSKSAAGVFDVKSSGYTYLRKITYLSSEDAKDVSKLEELYKNQNGVNTSVQPLVTENGMGYVRFDYVTNQENTKQLWFMESILFAAFMGILAILLFIRIRILKPFHTISEMPYELSKGHLKGELEESKSRFWGRFIWGISMLRDTLNDSKSQELKLLKEKKLLLLSISHDIKIPLSTIRLYAKAIKEDIYDTKEKRQYAAGQIEVHTKEIEDFVKEIMNASSEDLIHIEVNNADFYLKDYVEKIRQTYDTKMKVNLIDFRIEAYENCLLKGDFDR